ncbi:hypothetical protein SDC9_195035 [bioreactor metagenome]|uniref:Uncharacterized protein n=1 Tax=bioreactor metagenome TaxID=1076179 RepID=A0A645IJD1_9ZZZZ
MGSDFQAKSCEACIIAVILDTARFEDKYRRIERTTTKDNVEPIIHGILLPEVLRDS